MIARRAVLSALVLLAWTTPRAFAQSIPVRFEVATVRDSTFTFPLGADTWVRPGAEGIIVDATRRDALVASVRVVNVTATEAVGVVTGQTTRVVPGHVVVLHRRSRAWYLRGSFWSGVVLGALIGVVAASQ